MLGVMRHDATPKQVQGVVDMFNSTDAWMQNIVDGR
jgi:hypothetical protein